MNTPLKEYLARSQEILESPILDDINKETYNNEFLIMLELLHTTYTNLCMDYTKFKKTYKIAETPGPSPVQKIQSEELKIDQLVSIPPITLKWVPEINQYCLRINNLILRGNLCNIYNKHLLMNPNTVIDQLVKCSEGNECRTIKANNFKFICKFYHDPLELYIMRETQKISPEFYKAQTSRCKNFSNTAWLYTNCPRKRDNLNMRKIGSLSTLTRDADMLKLTLNKQSKAELEAYKLQVMHDILVLLFLNEQGLT